MAALNNQLHSLLTDLTLSTEQQHVIREAISAVNTAELILSELETSDEIIKNCIKNMTTEQCLNAAIDNVLDDLPAQWAFRKSERQEMIARGQRILRKNNG